MAKTMIIEYEEQADRESEPVVRKVYSVVWEVPRGKTTYKEGVLQAHSFGLSKPKKKAEGYFHLELRQGLEADEIEKEWAYFVGSEALRGVEQVSRSATATGVPWTIRLVEPIRRPSRRSEWNWRRALVGQLGIWGVVTVCLGIGYIVYGLTTGVWAVAVTGAVISSMVLVPSLRRWRKDAGSQASHLSIPVMTVRRV